MSIPDFKKQKGTHLAGVFQSKNTGAWPISTCWCKGKKTISITIKKKFGSCVFSYD